MENPQLHLMMVGRGDPIARRKLQSNHCVPYFISNKWTFRANHRNRKVLESWQVPSQLALSVSVLVDRPNSGNHQTDGRGTGFHQAIHPLYNCKDHHAEFHHVLQPLKYCNVCTVIKPNEAFLSHGGSPNHPVVMDDHDLVLKQAW